MHLKRPKDSASKGKIGLLSIAIQNALQIFSLRSNCVKKIEVYLFMQHCKDIETQTAEPFFRDVLFFCSFMLYLFLLKAADPQPFNKALSSFDIVIRSLWLKT